MTPGKPTNRIPFATALAGVVMLTGCAGSGSDYFAWETETTASPANQDQVIAWLPRASAQTPAVARAMTLVALGDAKRETESELCQGEWIFSGEIEEAGAPEAGTAPSSLGQYAAWHYRIAWNPELPDCNDVTPQQYYQALSRHLPEWVLIQTGSPVAVYHQGQPVFNQNGGVLLARNN